MKTFLLLAAPSIRIISAYFILFALLLAAQPSHAAPWSLDPAYGASGKFVRNVFTAPSSDSIRKIIEQPDGKLVAAGECDTGQKYAACLARYLPNGTLDISFGKNGVVRALIGTSFTVFTTLAMDGDKIVVAGACTQDAAISVYDYCFARYNANGLLDTSFNNGGTLIQRVGTSGFPLSLLITAGKYLAAGSCTSAGIIDSCYVRLNNNGSLDTNFGAQGVAVHSVNMIANYAISLAVDGDGFVAASTCDDGGRGVFCVMRYTSTGQAELGFGQQGKSSVRIGSVRDEASSVAIYEEKIYVGGACADVPYPGNFCIARLTMAGALDLTFNGAGHLTTEMRITIPATNSGLVGLVIENGKIYAGGYCEGETEAFCAARYDLNGALDQSFGVGGIAISVTVPNTGDYQTGDSGRARAMLVSNGRVTLAGDCVSPVSYTADFCIYRMTASGQKDATFGSNGRAISSFGVMSTPEKLLASAVQSDGKIIVSNRCFGFCVSRLNADGSVDLGFGMEGTVRLPSSGYVNDATAIAFQGGKIILAGVCGNDYCATRLNNDGSLDASFGGAGNGSTTIVVAPNPLYYPGVQSVVVLENNVLLIGGCRDLIANPGICVVRLTRDGVLDTTFATNGIARESTGLHGGAYGADPTRGLFSTFVDSTSITIAGRCTGNGLCAARFRIDGTLDLSFGVEGRAQIVRTVSLASTSALQKDGKILVAGACSNGTDDDFCVGRFNANGSVDSSFGIAGIVQTAIGSGNDRASGVLITDRAIILTGTCDNGTTTDFCIAAYKFDGSPALDVLDGGKQIIPVGNANDDAFTAHLVNRQLLLMGTCDGLKDADLCAARLQLPMSLFVPTANDLNGDSKSDLIVQSGSGTTAWLMNGSTISSATNLVANAPSWTLTHTADFNGDGKTDLLWRHTDGRIAIWLMNGTTLINGAGLIEAASGWFVTHVADFNGDGRADILFRHTDGRVAIWLMNGTTLTNGAGLLEAASGWTVTHVADFNGDGKADILFRHTDGRVAMWLMNGLTLISGAGLLEANSGWSISHTGDFNGDTKADILFRHTDGRVAMWLMNGLTLSSGAGLLNAASGWGVTHTADFNGDGTADIVFRHTDGRVAMWLMNGTNLTSGAGLLGAASGWSVTRTGDYNGDGKADLVFAHADGRIAVWLMNGATLMSGAGVAGPSSGLVVVP